jgi:sugar lactone lactonase YvrE
MIPDSPASCVADVHATLGEGPVRVIGERAHYWVDIKGRKVSRLDQQEQLTSWGTPFRMGSLARRESGGFIAWTPVARPTSCAFGGPSLDRLYVTSASIGLSEYELEMQPNAGGLFLVSPGVQGIADRPFAD